MPPELAGAGVAAAALALFLGLGLAADRYPFALDAAIMRALRGAEVPGWAAYAARDVTALGGGVVLTMVTAGAVGLLLVRRLRLTALALAAATVSGAYAVDFLKHEVIRARPGLLPHLAEASGYSFPSGHSANAAVVYLTLAALAGQVTPQRAVRRYLFAVAILVTGAVGTSRIYLGVHWPSDVAAGWCFGTLWALAWWTATARTRAAIGGER